MPPSILKRQFIGTLAALLLLVGALASVQSVAHAAHHAHHNAATHATAFCVWMCAAGQVLNSHAGHLEAGFKILWKVPDGRPVEPEFILCFACESRGPPSSLALTS